MTQRSEGPASNPPTDVGGFERGLQRACGIGLAAFLVQGLAVGVAGLPLYPLWWFLGPGLAAVVAMSGVVVTCLRGRSRTATRLAAVAVVGACSVLTAVATAETVTRTGTVVQPLVTGLVGLIGLMDRPRIALPAGALLTGVQVGSMALTRPLAPPDVLIVLLIDGALLVAAAAAGLIARRSAVAQDVANERLTRALVADRAAARSRSDRREQERVLHDTVLSTLTALARGSLPDSDAVRARCAADARFLRAMHEADDLDDPPDLVTALLAIARDTAHPEVVVEGETITVELPAQVAVAILRAAGEAVRNAGRHSGADRVEVRIAAVGTGVTVEIVDDGRGFAPGDGRGLGIRRSITERMGDVGGYGTVEHVSGRGTRVVLAWPR